MKRQPQTGYLYNRDGSHYFACKLVEFVSPLALGTELSAYLASNRKRQLDLLNCLMNPRDDRITYDLRIISQPNRSEHPSSLINVVLLCRMVGFSLNEAESQAQQIIRFLQASFEDYHFDLVPETEIRDLLLPFDYSCVAEITRRCERSRLDTLQAKRRRERVGFSSTEETPAVSESPENAIVHLYPFLATSDWFDRLFRLLVLESSPLVISCMLRPTTLPAAVAEFLEKQIALCERFAQIGLYGLPLKEEELRPTLQEHARQYQRLQARLLYGLRDNAALIQLRVASTSPISQTVVDTLGSLVTEPAGGKAVADPENLARYLCGGYEVQFFTGDALQKAASALTHLEIIPAAHPLLPEAVGQLLYLFDSIEAQCPFRIPPSSPENLPGVKTRHWRLKPPAVELPREGTVIGMTETRTGKLEVRMHRNDRRQHMYVVGKTGTGKSTLLKTMILSDMAAGEGLAVIDPHGDLFDELLGTVPKNRWEDVVVFDPMDLDYPIGLNLLDCSELTQRYFVVREMRSIMERLIQDQYGHKAAEYAGPAFYQHMQMNMLLAMSNPDDPGTLLEFYEIFQHKDYWERWKPLKWQEPQLKRWVEVNLPSIDYTKRYNDQITWGEYLSSKFDDFVFDPKLRLIFGQKRSTIDLRQIMDEGKILLVNLRKGELAESNARFLGMILMAKILQTAMQRTKVAPEHRKLFYLYVDEFQSLATESFVLLLSEARKFGISLILANQFISQINDERIIQSVFGNVGTLISFRVGHEDAELIAPHFAPVFNSYDLTNLPNWTACMKSAIQGKVVAPFSLMTVVPKRPPDNDVATRILQKSRQKNGRRRQEVEAEIEKSLLWES
jgi:hypothetical protein